MEWLGVVLGVGGGLWAAVTFNRIVRLRLLAVNAWSDIDVLLKQRHDLIPNLVAAVKGYAAFESATLEEVTRLRSLAQEASTLPQKASAEGELQAGLSRFFALVENYPDLKAGAQFRELQSQLIRVEEQLQNARRYYNAVVRDHNTYLETFPNNVLAQILSMSLKPFFQIEEEVRATPVVKVS